jgi:peroxiredoxin
MTTMKSRLTAGLACLAAGITMIGAGAMNESSAEAQLKPAQVGEKAPDFTLTDLEGNKYTLSEYTAQGNIVVLEWFNPTCPFVKKHYREDTMTMVNMEKEYKDQDIVWLRVNSARAGHDTGDVDMNKDIAEKWNITTPILRDTKGTVGKAYGAKRTPEMYVISTDGTLVYHGAIDNRPDAAAPGDVNYVTNAINETLAGKSVTDSETKAYGCGVKY